jgi:glycosyltransferase involved in cell wall biosynthesis
MQKTETLSITAIVLTKDEESSIARTLGSLEFFKEILVIDSGSTDRTVEIAEVFSNVRIIKTQWLGFSKTKEIGIKQSSCDWIFWIDADEEVTKKLQDEFFSLKFENGNDVYRIKRQNFFMGKKINFSGWQKDKVIRLFNKNFSRLNGSDVHEKVDYQGKVVDLNAPMNHFTYKDLKNYLAKIDSYTTLGAKQRINQANPGPLSLLTKPMFRFFRHYFLQLGLLDGQQGLVISLLSSYSVFLRTLKLSRLKNGEEI